MSNTLTAEQVIASAPNATVLTIDFFDTLVTRTVAQPTHVFAVMEAALAAGAPLINDVSALLYDPLALGALAGRTPRPRTNAGASSIGASA